ncbi:amidohydrolase family protein [Bradyrhizobium ganzhouense]|uniref:amidohydrolase family protein n=1 Tax=Bradyrhizobium ganzhouense TaxID=1179767 RepID=UPI003CFA7B8E
MAGLAASVLPHLATAQQVRWSSGSEKPRFVVPPGATDCHFHTYDKTYPVMKGATLLPDDALPEDYRALQRRIGTTRGVIIQPSTYGTDNRLQIASRHALGAENFRVIAVVPEDVSDADLRQLDEQGVRGVRFNLGFPGALTLDSLKSLAPRLADLGWHCQINMRPKQIEDNADLLASLPGRLVFDHLAQIPQPAGLESAPYKIVRGLLDRGKTWVKLSGPYVSSKQGAPDYADAGAVATECVKAAPERLVWGSDWPHPSEKDYKPDDARLFDLFAQCAGDAATFKRILVDNPVELYSFAKVVPKVTP